MRFRTSLQLSAKVGSSAPSSVGAFVREGDLGIEGGGVGAYICELVKHLGVTYLSRLRG